MHNIPCTSTCRKKLFSHTVAVVLKRTVALKPNVDFDHYLRQYRCDCKNNHLLLFSLDVLCCAGIVQTQWPFVRVVKTINDYELKISRDRRPKIQNAGITKCDIIAKNGIILEVNDVISAKAKESQIEDFNSFLNI